MRASGLIGFGLLVPLALGAPASATQDDSVSATSSFPASAATSTSDAASVLADLLSDAQDTAKDILNSTSSQKRGGCTLSNLSIRREWSTLSTSDKKAYINAVLCLQKKQANTPSSLAAGAKTRFDDFTATHINQTLTIHYTGTFLAWHRYFTWTYEQSLRTECGYTGTQPYWDWSKSAVTGMEKYPVFDGSDTSMSGNGAVVANEGDVILGGNGLPDLYLPPGTGGGCVTSGPFKNMTVNLGPVALALTDGTTVGAAVTGGDPLAYNPRCLKRDLTTAINRRYANASSVVNLILKNNDIYDFEMVMQGIPGSGDIGVHGGGHYALGGDPGRDVWVSPSDPAFFLHHGMIDRTWWIWQLLDPQNRINSENAISGTGTFLNTPPSANTTLETVIDLGYSRLPNQPLEMADLMSTISGPFCYIYA